MSFTNVVRESQLKNNKKKGKELCEENKKKIKKRISNEQQRKKSLSSVSERRGEVEVRRREISSRFS